MTRADLYRHLEAFVIMGLSVVTGLFISWIFHFHFSMDFYTTVLLLVLILFSMGVGVLWRSMYLVGNIRRRLKNAVLFALSIICVSWVVYVAALRLSAMLFGQEVAL